MADFDGLKFRGGRRGLGPTLGAVKLLVTFPKTADGRNRSRFSWSDGVSATSWSNGRPGVLPHDLEHYAIEAQLSVPYGFWALAGRQAPFKSLVLTRGRWPKGRAEWFERVKAKHGGELIQAETVGGLVHSLSTGDLDVRGDWPRIKTMLRRAYTYESDGPFTSVTPAQLESLVPFHDRLHRLWDEVPVGGALQVSWPCLEDPRPVAKSISA